MKTVKTILIVLAAVLLIITAVLYFVDAPVVEDGQEPTMPQKIILLGKEYLTEILAALGVSAVGLLTYLVKKIYDSGKGTLLQSLATSTDVQKFATRLQNVESKLETYLTNQQRIERKQDIINDMLYTIFSLSELPLSVREKIQDAKDRYGNLDGVRSTVEQLNVEPQNTEVEPAESLVEVCGEKGRTQCPSGDPAQTQEESEKGPVFM